MNRTLKRIFLFSLVGLVLIYLVGRRLGWFDWGSMPEKNIPAAAVKLQVNAMVVNLIELDNKILTTGSILPDESVDLSSETAGKITSLLFKEGSRVRKGDLLLSINDADLQAQMQRLKYQSALLQDREYRQRMLLEKEAVSREVYDKALTDLNTNRAEISVLEAQIAKTRVVAPFDGIIGLRYVSEGSYINPSVRIATLTKLQPVKIEFTIPERYATQVGVGNRITFSTGNSSQVYEAKVYAIEPIIDQTTRTLKLRALYANNRMEVMPGTFANIELVLETYHNTVNIPSEAVVPEQGAFKVFIYKNGKAEQVNVEVGIRSSDKIQVTQGLQAGDTVITTGLLQLRKGMAVDIATIQ